MLNKIKTILSTNKMFLLIAFAIFAVPLSAIINIPGTDLWYVQYVALFSLLIFGIAFRLFRFNKFISIFLMYMCFSTVYIVNMNLKAILVMVQTALCALAVYQISRLSYKQTMMLIKCLLVMAVIQGFYVIVQYFNLDPIFSLASDTTLDDTVGFSGSHNQIGLYLASVVPVVLFQFPLFIVIIIFGIYCSTTSIAFMSLLFSCLYYVYFKCYKLFIPLLVVVIFSGIFWFTCIETFSGQKFVERYGVWKHSITAVERGVIKPRYGNVIKVVEANKWLGFGNATFTSVNTRSQGDALKWVLFPFNHVYEHAHNDYVEMYFEFGRLGFIWILLFVIDLFIKFFRSRKNEIILISFGGLLSFMICACIIYTVYNAVSGSLFVLFLGIFLGEIRRQREVLDGT